MRYDYPANVSKSCATMDHGALGTSDDNNGSFCCFPMYSLQMEHWLAPCYRYTCYLDSNNWHTVIGTNAYAHMTVYP